MSLFPHHSGSTSTASEQPALRVSLPGAAPSASTRRLSARVIGCGAAVLSAVLVLTACGTSSPANTSTPTPKDDKVFRSTAEAKKAAVDASQRFWDTYLSVQGEPDQAKEEFLKVASEEIANSSAKAVKELTTSGKVITGKVTVESFTPTLAEPSRSRFKLEGYVCANFKDARIRDEGGRDVTSANRPDKQAIEVRYEPIDSHSQSLKIQSAGDVLDADGRCS